VPDGYITAIIALLETPSRQINTRQAIGWVALIGIIALFGWLVYSERRSPTRRSLAGARQALSTISPA